MGGWQDHKHRTCCQQRRDHGWLATSEKNGPEWAVPQRRLCQFVAGHLQVLPWRLSKPYEAHSLCSYPACSHSRLWKVIFCAKLHLYTEKKCPHTRTLWPAHEGLHRWTMLQGHAVHEGSARVGVETSALFVQEGLGDWVHFKLSLTYPFENWPIILHSHGSLGPWYLKTIWNSDICIYMCIWRVPDQKGVSQAWYIVEIHHSGREPSILYVYIYVSIYIIM